MKLIITENGVVLSTSYTNLVDPLDTRLIEVGECYMHLVADSDTHIVGDVFKPVAIEPVAPAEPVDPVEPVAVV
jgi:hypothetical protein